MDEFSWFIGIFEGEGSFRFVKMKNRKDCFGLSLCIKMTDEDTILRCYKAVGKVGIVHGPYLRHSKNKPMWDWTLNRIEDVYALIKRMYPYLGARRRTRANDLIDYCIRKRGLEDFRIAQEPKS